MQQAEEASSRDAGLPAVGHYDIGMNRSEHRTEETLPPRSPKGGRPPQDVAALLGAHILVIALDRFGRLGVEQTTMEIIAAAANVSKRTLYDRFGSKNALLIKAIEYGIAHHLAPLTTNAPVGTVREQLLYIGERMLDASLKKEVVRLQTLIGWIAINRSEIYKRVQIDGISQPIAIIRKTLDAAILRGELPRNDIDFLSTFLFDCMVSSPRNRILVRLDLENSRKAKRAYLEQAIDVLLNGCGRPAAESRSLNRAP